MPDPLSISIIVPNYNGGSTIGRTLQSLVDQHYPNLEIVVVDGGSTDNSVDVIKQYEKHITWWVSEKDRGQSHAINKGFARASGEIINWLCSDDELTPGCLAFLGEFFARNPGIDVLSGTCRFIYAREPWRNHDERPSQDRLDLMPCCNPIPQPSCFFRRRLLKRSPVVVEDLHYTMDYELWCYLRSQSARWALTDQVLSIMYFSGDNKTSVGREKITYEWERVYRQYACERIPLTYWHRRLRYPLERLRRRYPGRVFGAIYYPYQCAVIATLSPFYGFSRTRWMNWVEFS